MRRFWFLIHLPDWAKTLSGSCRRSCTIASLLSTVALGGVSFPSLSIMADSFITDQADMASANRGCSYSQQQTGTAVPFPTARLSLQAVPVC